MTATAAASSSAVICLGMVYSPLLFAVILTAVFVKITFHCGDVCGIGGILTQILEDIKDVDDGMDRDPVGLFGFTDGGYV